MAKRKKIRLCWSVHLLRQRPAVGGAVCLALGLLLWASWVLLGHPLLWLLVCLIFLGSLGDYLLPLRYECTEGELVLRTPFRESRFSWSDFRSFGRLPRGIQLRRLPRPSMLDAFRSVNLYFTPDDEERILDFVRRKIG